MKKWSFMATEESMRVLLLTILTGLILYNSTLFEREYNEKLMTLYTYPWWRLLLVMMILASASWSPELSIFLTFAVFFYLSDMNTLIQPIVNG
jgi:hypothetical protein